MAKDMILREPEEVLLAVVIWVAVALGLKEGLRARSNAAEVNHGGGDWVEVFGLSGFPDGEVLRGQV